MVNCPFCDIRLVIEEDDDLFINSTVLFHIGCPYSFFMLPHTMYIYNLKIDEDSWYKIFSRKNYLSIDYWGESTVKSVLRIKTNDTIMPKSKEDVEKMLVLL